MGISGGPNIVRDSSLVLELDAADRNSYVSGSINWVDLSGNGNTGTFFSGSGYSTVNSGTIVFDGVNTYATSSFFNTSSLNTNAITLEAWVYHLSLSNKVQRYVSTSPSGSEQAVIRFDGPVSNSTLRFYIVTSTGYKFLTLSGQLFINNWYHVVGTWDGTTQKMYNNTNLVASSTQTGTLVTGSTSYYISLPSEVMSGYISIARIYNRALSAQEIQQNYSALKSRFNL
jgi:hypothetical protein